MNINEQNLRKIIAGVPVGDYPPFNQGRAKSANACARQLCKKITALRMLDVTQSLDSYGSGYASYFDIFITKSDKSSTIDRGHYIEKKGITFYISRLAPIAVYGKSVRTLHDNGGSYGFLDCESIGTTPKGDWSREIEAVRQLLNIYKYAVLPSAEVSKQLWFETKIPTILDGETVFDALFYWED